MPSTTVSNQSKKIASNKKNSQPEDDVKESKEIKDKNSAAQSAEKKGMSKGGKKPQQKSEKASEAKSDSKQKAKAGKKSEKKEGEGESEVQVPLSEEFDQILEAFAEVNKRVKELMGRVKVLQRRVGREHRDLEKAAKGKRKKNQASGEKQKRQPSGFAKPTNLSKELCSFLNVDENTQLARTDVTKKITTYVKEHNLQNPKNKKEIKPDSKLGALLKVPKEEVLTYFNLQKYLKHHFQKAQPAN